MNWRTTRPPKRKVKLIKIRFQEKSTGRIYVGKCYWSDIEKTWIATEGEGLGLYPEHYKVLGWKELES